MPEPGLRQELPGQLSVRELIEMIAAVGGFHPVGHGDQPFLVGRRDDGHTARLQDPPPLPKGLPDIRDVLDDLACEQGIELAVTERHGGGVEDGPGLLRDLERPGVHRVIVEVAREDLEREVRLDLREQGTAAPDVNRPPAGRYVAREQVVELLELVSMQLGQERGIAGRGVPVGGVVARVERAQDLPIGELQQYRLEVSNLTGWLSHDELEITKRVERVVGIVPALDRREPVLVDQHMDGIGTDGIEIHDETRFLVLAGKLEPPPSKMSVRMRVVAEGVDVSIEDVARGFTDGVPESDRAATIGKHDTSLKRDRAGAEYAIEAKHGDHSTLRLERIRRCGQPALLVTSAARRRIAQRSGTRRTGHLRRSSVTGEASRGRFLLLCST